jgi:hypothetical protein
MRKARAQARYPTVASEHSLQGSFLRYTAESIALAMRNESLVVPLAMVLQCTSYQALDCS